MTQTKLPNIPKTEITEMFWRYKGGSTWDPVISEFCLKHGIPAILDDKQEFDLYIWTPRAVYGIELKATDMHSSLFPKNTTTSLEREFKGDEANKKIGYINAGFDHVVLIYIHENMDLIDLLALDRLMFKFPTIRRKSYMSQKNAVAGIYRMVQKGIPRTNLDEPSYFSQNLGNTLANQLVRIPGVSAENALELSKLFNYDPSRIYSDKNILEILRKVFPDLKNKDYYHMVYVIFDYYMGGVEPLKNKKIGVKNEN